MSDTPTNAAEKVTRTDAEWRSLLTPEQYSILRQAGTERPGTGRYWKFTADGSYACAGCGQVLFTADQKFDSHCGWPSFDRVIPGTVTLREDRSHGMRRVEVVCSRCDGHLGHVFEDGPTETGTRFCINSASLNFIQK